MALKNSQVDVRGSRPLASPGWINGNRTAAALRLRLQKSCDVPEPVSDRRAVDSPERAADVHPTFPLKHFYTASPYGGVDLLIDPRPGHRGHLRQIANPRHAAHITATPQGDAPAPI
jgi:hypothetical protein